MIPVEFRDINKKYIACSDGTIWRRGRGGDISIIKPSLEANGMKKVLLFIDGVYKLYEVHKLILSAFLGEKSSEILFLDGDCSNTSLENLAYKSVRNNV